ncbi:MAG: class I SAM-dependent methyltransferase [Bacteroidia bacterium]
MSELNLKTYNSTRIVKWYDNLNAVTLVEKHFFETNKELIAQGSVLDIGIGGGRTTSYLINKCKKYIGIDYSEGFVNAVKKKHLTADIRLMNATDLSEFENNSFDLINFSFNGIDYVGFEDRKKILSEIHRVLKPNGLFLFSTHNKDHFTYNRAPWSNAQNGFITNLKNFIKLLPFLPRHLNQKSKEIHLQDYAIINDSAHNYNLLTFYTSPAFLKQQLTEHKFGNIALFSKNATLVEEGELDDWIFISCEKLSS